VTTRDTIRFGSFVRLSEICAMKISDRYVKCVEWSDEDQCYVGTAPGLLVGGCHGSDERAVFDELCQIVEETIEIYLTDGRPLPPPTHACEFVRGSYYDARI
jgi:predicted RNase H-like HicB family nuclease